MEVDPLPLQTSSSLWRSYNTQTRHPSQTDNKLHWFSLLHSWGISPEVFGSFSQQHWSSVKNSEHFIQLIKYINLQNGDMVVGYDVVSLFTNEPVEQPLQVIRNMLCVNPVVLDHSLYMLVM